MKYQINFKRINSDNKIIKDSQIGNTENESIEEAIDDIVCSWAIEPEEVTGLYKIEENHKGSKTCPRCGGVGNLDQHLNFHNGICFQCDGLGKVEDIEVKKTKLNLKKYINEIKAYRENIDND